MKLINPVSNLIQSIILKTMSDWKVIGKGNVPPVGSLIIVANHQSAFDPSLLSTSIPRSVKFLAKQDIFHRGPASWFLRSYGAYPLNRERIGVHTYRWITTQLQNDGVIVIFPEGTRSIGGMRRARPGIAKLAIESQAAILPVGISGTSHLGTWLRVLNPTGKIRVNIGSPFTLPNVEGRLNHEVLMSLTDLIMEKVAVLLPLELQGVYMNKKVECQN